MVSVSRVLSVGAGLLLVAGLVRCTAFDSTPETLVPDAAPGARDGGAEAAPSQRMGVACGAGDTRCAVGEKCCWSSDKSIKACAANCAAIDAGAVVFECGQSSDCPDETNVCCMSLNYCGAGSAVFGSTCVPSANCAFCGDGGGAGRGCDRSRNDECQGGQECKATFDRYAFCAR